MLIYNTPAIIPIGTVLNTSLNGQALPLTNMFCFAIQVVFTGTPTGLFFLEGSADQCSYNTAKPTQGLPTNWLFVPNSDFTVTAAGDCMWNYEASPGFNWVRVCYTDSSSGTSTAVITDATINAKGM